MQLRIWSIAKANARIDELEAQVASLTTELSTAKAALEANNGEVTAAAEQISKDLDTAKQTIGTLTGQIAAATTALAAKDTEIKALNDRLAKQPEEVKVQVAREVANVQAKLGQPPVPAASADKSPNSGAAGRRRVVDAAKADLDAAGYVPKRG